MRLAALAENPCNPSGLGITEAEYAEGMLTNWGNPQVCRTTAGIEVPCPIGTSIDVSADMPDEESGVPGWVWALSAGMIGLAVLGKRK